MRKFKLILPLVLLIVALTLVALTMSTTLVVSANSARVNPIREASERWDEAFNAAAADPNDENMAKLMDLYDNNAVDMPPGFSTIVGKDAIRADFVFFFSEFVSHHETTIVDILMSGNLAVEQADYYQTFTPRDGSASFEEHGKHIVVYKKSGKSWKVVKEIWNTTQ